jgi:YidC/Oxa1 family membrane protein insertase
VEQPRTRLWRAIGAACALALMVGLLSGCSGKAYPPVKKEQRKAVEKALDVSGIVSVDDELVAQRKKIAANPESAEAAEAQFRVGVINEKKGNDGKGDTDGAVSAYDAVLEKYASSPFAAVAAYRKAELLCNSENPEKRKAAVKAYEGVLGMMMGQSGKKDAPVAVAPVEQKDGSIKWVPAKELIPSKLDTLYKDRVSYQVLNALVAVSAKITSKGAYGLAIVFLTIIVKLLITPLTRKQYESMKDMQKVQPEVKKLQEKLKGEPQKLNQEVMALYKKHGVNPLGGCFPLLIQMPVLIWLYQAIMAFRLQFEGHGFLWVDNLSAPDRPLLVLYLVSMVVSQRLTTMPTADPQQQQTQKMMAYMMPIMMAFMFQTFPSAFILYWLMFNILSTLQQYLIMRGGSDKEERKLGIKTLIPNFLSAIPKKDSPPVVQAPADLDRNAQGASQRKRTKKRRR